MLQPSRRRFMQIDTYRPLIRPLTLGCTLALASACSSFFKLSPEEEAAGGAAKPATAPKPVEKPAPKVEKPKEEKPPKVETPKVEKPKVEKPKEEKPKEVEKKPEVKVAEKPAEKPPEKVVEKKAEPAPKPVKEPAPPKPDKSNPVVVTPAPPEVRRVEPVIEPAALEPTPAGSDSAGVARLVQAAVLWDAIRLFHPAAAIDRSAWDNETVRRLTDVRTANTREQYVTTLREWVSRLNDPITRLAFGASEGDVATDASGTRDVAMQSQIVVTGSKKTRVVDTTVVLTWPSSVRTNDQTAWNNLRDAVERVGSASQVVIDLRTGINSFGRFEDQTKLRETQLEVANVLSSMTVAGPSVRRRVYEGWADERSVTSPTSAGATWRVSDPLVVVRGQAPQRMRRLVFVANEHTAMPPALLALVSSKQATLVSDAALSDELLAPTRRIPLGQGITAIMRVGELINADGSVGIRPDTMVAPSASPDSAPSIRTAIQIARGKLSPRARVSTIEPPVTGATVASNAWSNAHYPIMGARLLAAFKLWGTLRTFHAYNDLRDESLDDALTRFIPRVEAATDAYSYSSVMLELATTVNDAQSVMSSPTIEQHLGVAAAPFAVRWIEGRAIVTQVVADEAGRATGLAVGDEITAADGYPMPAYVTEHRKYGAWSNEWTAYRNIAALIPRGVPGDAVFKVRDGSNRERTATIPRSASYLNRLPDNERASTSVFRAFTGGVGYLDLDRATTEQVDSAFQILSSARALIIDARGQGTPNTSATMTPAMQNVLRRLVSLPNAVIDRQTVRVASEPCAPTESRFAAIPCAIERRQFEEVISVDSVNRYRGRVVILIDERTQGAMEQFGVGAGDAGNPVFIGSPSAGAAGSLTSVNLPGLITLTFSGSELRHADGRQLQRVGLTPQVEVSPTVKGVRAGTDEVLARAQAWLLQQLDPAPVRRKP